MMSRTQLLAFAILPCLATALHAAPADLARWSAQPADWKGAKIAETQATVSADKWSFLTSPEEHTHVEVLATVHILEPAKQFRFFGDGWSAWPDPTFGDAGFEAGLLLRAGKNSGYRVQLSHKYQAVALVKYPDGGYVRVVPFP